MAVATLKLREMRKILPYSKRFEIYRQNGIITKDFDLSSADTDTFDLEEVWDASIQWLRTVFNATAWSPGDDRVKDMLEERGLIPMSHNPVENALVAYRLYLHGCVSDIARHERVLSEAFPVDRTKPILDASGRTGGVGEYQLTPVVVSPGLVESTTFIPDNAPEEVMSVTLINSPVAQSVVDVIKDVEKSLISSMKFLSDYVYLALVEGTSTRALVTRADSAPAGLVRMRFYASLTSEETFRCVKSHVLEKVPENVAYYQFLEVYVLGVNRLIMQSRYSTYMPVSSVYVDDSYYLELGRKGNVLVLQRYPEEKQKQIHSLRTYLREIPIVPKVVLNPALRYMPTAFVIIDAEFYCEKDAHGRFLACAPLAAIVRVQGDQIYSYRVYADTTNLSVATSKMSHVLRAYKGYPMAGGIEAFRAAVEVCVAEGLMIFAKGPMAEVALMIRYAWDSPTSVKLGTKIQRGEVFLGEGFYRWPYVESKNKKESQVRVYDLPIPKYEMLRRSLWDSLTLDYSYAVLETGYNSIDHHPLVEALVFANHVIRNKYLFPRLAVLMEDNYLMWVATGRVQKDCPTPKQMYTLTQYEDRSQEKLTPPAVFNYIECSRCFETLVAGSFMVEERGRDDPVCVNCQLGAIPDKSATKALNAAPMIKCDACQQHNYSWLYSKVQLEQSRPKCRVCVVAPPGLIGVKEKTLDGQPVAAAIAAVTSQ